MANEPKPQGATQPPTAQPTTQTPVAEMTVGTPEEWQRYAEEQHKEYAQFVALQNIEHGGALAYTRGDPVPASNVERYGYLDQGVVAKANTKAAQEAAADQGRPAGWEGQV